MQIHELNQRPSNKEPVQEVFQAAYNLGKQIVANPKSLISHTAMGQAKAAAQQQTFAQTSAKLSKQGYTTAAGPKKAQDLLPQVKTNAATQQMVKTLAGQWQEYAKQIPGQAVKEGIVNELIAPGTTSTARYSAPTGAYAQRPAGYGQTTQRVTTPLPVTPQPSQQQQTQAQMAQQFTDWANSKLAALNVDPDDINKDPAVANTLKNLASKIAANPNSTNDVVEYFNLAIAANIADTQARRSGIYQPTTGTSQATPQQVTQQAGLNAQFLQGLGAVLRKADPGSMTMPRTGNPVADAMFQQMGFKIK